MATTPTTPFNYLTPPTTIPATLPPTTPKLNYYPYPFYTLHYFYHYPPKLTTQTSTTPLPLPLHLLLTPYGEGLRPSPPVRFAHGTPSPHYPLIYIYITFHNFLLTLRAQTESMSYYLTSYQFIRARITKAKYFYLTSNIYKLLFLYYFLVIPLASIISKHY